MDQNKHILPAQTNRREYIKLFVIYAFIIGIATIMSTLGGFNWQEWMRWFMGGFFIIFGSFKLIGYESFVELLPSYDIIAKRFHFYAYLYPFIQLALGGLFILNAATLPIGVTALIFGGISSYGIIKSTSPDHQTAHFAYLGNTIRLPFLTVNVYENLTVTVVSAVIVVTLLVT